MGRTFDDRAKLEVRPARREDIPAILGFVRALAEYERLAEHVRATEDDLARDLFAPEPKVFCDLALRDGRPVGCTVWFYSYSTFAGRHGIYLEDLFVDETARGSGAGLALVRALARRCRREGLARIDWMVLDWNRLALDFYDALGAVPPTGWLNRRLAGEALARLAES